MSIVTANVCSNCRRFVPEQCDGRVFETDKANWPRPVCRGDDCDIRREGGKHLLRITMGHGCTYDVELTEVA